MTPQFATKIFLAFLCAKHLVEAWLDNKNKRHILANRNKVPEKFQDQISLEDHQKAATYSVAKIKAAQTFHIIDFIVLLLWTVGGGLDLLDHYVLGMDLSVTMRGVAFFALFGLISTVIGIPQSIYNTFVLEEKFGFNKTTPKIFIVDMIKGLVVGAIIGLPIVYAILWIMSGLGENWWMYAWAFLTVVQLILIWAYPTFIAPIFNKFAELEEGEVKNKIVELLTRCNFESNGLYVMDASKRSSHGNAYFTGLGKAKRIVFFDTLIKTLDPEEVEAVLAHELGHFKRKHVMKMIIRSFIFSFIGFAILGFLANNPLFFVAHGVTTISPYMALTLFMMVSGVYTFFMTPIQSKLSRKQEFEADEFAHIHSSGEKLISALVKMYKDNASTLTPDPTYSAFYHSHPPALIRVKFLESLQESKA